MRDAAWMKPWTELLIDGNDDMIACKVLLFFCCASALRIYLPYSREEDICVYMRTMIYELRKKKQKAART